MCLHQSDGWAKVNTQRFEKQIKFRWGIVQLLLPIFNCKWQSVFPQSGIWQLIASLSSWASIFSLMILLMGGLFALTAHYDKHIYPLTFRGLWTNGAIKSFNCALPHCLGAICTLLGRGGVVMERIPQSVTWVKAQGNFPASQPKMWNFFDSVCKVFIGHLICGQHIEKKIRWNFKHRLHPPGRDNYFVKENYTQNH